MNLLWLVSTLAVLIGTVENHEAPPNKLLYIMIDGFRYDYVDLQSAESLPGFTRFLQGGVRAEWMSPIFPSISYPDWTTLVTGLWVEAHGIVGNFFYDSETKDVFHLGTPESTGMSKWWTAEPIWTTSTKADRDTAVIRWSRCDVAFSGILPRYCKPFDMNEQSPQSFQANAETALQLLGDGYDFVLLYTPFIDSAGHYEGPESQGVRHAVRTADATILHILNTLQETGLSDKVNIVIVSDHGMKDVTASALRHVALDDYLDLDKIEQITEAGAFANIKVLPGHIQTVYNSLDRMPGVRVYLHKDIPEELHYKNSKYVHDILIMADSDTFILQSKSEKQIPRIIVNEPDFLGAHGYDPKDEKMRAIFFASGPDFESDKQIAPIQNVDVYPLLAHLLKINPLPNNGTISKFSGALRRSTDLHSSGAFVGPSCIMILCLLLVAKCNA